VNLQFCDGANQLKYFVPKFNLDSELPAQNKFEEKFGGLPWGLRIEQIPVCSHCNKYQTLIAQFLHHPMRLNLGASGRVLCVFQCEHDCPCWEGGSGANACFVVDAHEITNCATPFPNNLPPVNPEIRIVDWFECEDGVRPEQASDFYDDQKYANLPEELFDSIPNLTRLGGVPIWCQSADEAPKGWQFIGQFEESHSVFEAPSGQRWESHIWEPGTWYERRWLVGSHNFGTGSAYIFLHHQFDKPEGWFFWQC
jgi:hypothetical protein